MTLPAALTALTLLFAVSACKTPPNRETSTAVGKNDQDLSLRTGTSPNGTRMNPAASGDRTYYVEREVATLSKQSREALPPCQVFVQSLDALQSHTLSDDPALLFQDRARALQAIALLEKAPGTNSAGRKAWKLVTENPQHLPPTVRFATALKGTLAHCAPLQISKALEGLLKGRNRLSLTSSDDSRVQAISSRFLERSAEYPADVRLMSAGASLMRALAETGQTQLSLAEARKLEQDAYNLSESLTTLSAIVPEGMTLEEAAKRVPQLLPGELKTAEAFRRRLESAVNEAI